MTNELEKQFFDTFGIEKELTTCEAGRWGKCPNPKLCIDICSYKKSTKLYPQISDRILLELICILTKFYGELVLEQCLDVNDLKKQVLNIFIKTSYKDNFKHQVHTLFEEG